MNQTLKILWKGPFHIYSFVMQFLSPEHSNVVVCVCVCVCVYLLTNFMHIQTINNTNTKRLRSLSGLHTSHVTLDKTLNLLDVGHTSKVPKRMIWFLPILKYLKWWKLTIVVYPFIYFCLKVEILSFNL